jgi:hypothetical protein
MINFKLKYNMSSNIFLCIFLYRSNRIIITFINQKNLFRNLIYYKSYEAFSKTIRN